MNDTNGSLKKQKNIGLIALIAALVIVFSGGTGLYAYQYFLNKNPMIQYLKAEKHTFESMFDYYETYRGTFNEFNDRFMTEPYESSIAISADFSIDSDQLRQNLEYNMIRGIFSAAKLNLHEKYSPATKEVYTGAELVLQGANLFDAQFYQNETTSALQIPMLYDKYFTLENNKLGEFIRNIEGSNELEIEEIPNIVDMQQTGMTVRELKEIALDYLNVMGEHIGEDHFTVTEDAVYQGETYHKISLSLTEEEVKRILRDLLETLKEDDRIWGFYTIFPSERALIRDGMVEMIHQIESLELSDGLTIDAYLDGEQVKYRVAEIEGVKITLATEVNKNDQYELVLTLDATSDVFEEPGMIQYRESGQPNEGGYHVSRKFSFKEPYVEQETMVFTVENDYYDNQESKTAFELTMNGPEFQVSPKISGYIQEQLEDYRDEQASLNMEIGFNIDFNDPMFMPGILEVIINAETDVTFTNDLEFPQLKERDTVNLMNLSPDEGEELLFEMEQNAERYFKSLFGNFGLF